MQFLRIFSRLARDDKGATLVEFAIVAVIFLTLLLGIIEYGLMMMTKVALEAATQQAGRSSAINTGMAATGCPDRACAVERLVKQRTSALIHSDTVVVSAQVISSPTATATIPTPDICVDTPNNPSTPGCTNWLEMNNVTGYQPAGGVTPGNANELVEIRVSYPWQVMFPLLQPFFKNGIAVLTSSTIVKNEPF